MSILQRAIGALVRSAATPVVSLLSNKAPVSKLLSDPVLDRGGWIPIIRESFAGAWQQNVEIDFNSVLSNYAVFACMSLIASDIAKLRIKLVAKEGAIWVETNNPAYSPVLRKPNHYQNRIQFWENWMLSKLSRGNTYVLKGRDARNVVVAMYPLDPNRVRPLIADETGDIFYELNTDNLTNIKDRVVVPAREIIHDRFNCLFHPLVGTSPLFAAGLSATYGLSIQKNATNFFANQSLPGGILTAPGHIDPVTAERLKTEWNDRFSGVNRGKTAVLGDDLKFEKLTMTAEESQLIEQLKWSGEVVCSVFHVPPYKIGVGPLPSYNNVQALNVEYYTQCLQRLIEDAEICLDEGLSMAENIGTEFDLDGLLRMDALTQIEVLDKGKNMLTPNEQRRRINLPDVEGGNSVYRQQQDYSLEALAKRDAQANPFASGSPAPAPAGQPKIEDQSDEDDDEADEEDEKSLNYLEFTRLLMEGTGKNAQEG